MHQPPNIAQHSTPRWSAAASEGALRRRYGLAKNGLAQRGRAGVRLQPPQGSGSRLRKCRGSARWRASF